VAEVKFGQFVGIGAGSNNHGCMNYAVAQVAGQCEGLDHDSVTVVIEEVQSCHSCWQVGHDSDYVFYTVGDVISIPLNEIRKAGRDWARNVEWEW